MALSLLRRRPRVGASIDLGTAFVRVGTATDELALERTTSLPGNGPAAMVDGFVNDVDAAGALLAAALDEAAVARGRRARLVVSIPATATPVERCGLLWAIAAAGVRHEPILVEEPLAAAIGLGLDIADPTPHLIVDVGHGITEAAVVIGGTVAAVEAVRVGTGALEKAVVTAVSTGALPEPAAVDAPFDLLARAFDGGGSPVDEAVRRAAEPVLACFARTVARALAAAPIDTAAAIGCLHLVGGGSLLPCVARRLGEETGLEVRLASNRFHAVALGDAVCATEAFRLDR